VIIGESGVGKSNLMTRYVNNEFSEDTASTVGVDFLLKTMRIQNTDMKIQFWDTAGQERFRAIARPVYRGAKGAMIVYDITNQISFNHLPMWLQEVRNYAPSDVVIILVGNKTDLEAERVVSLETAKQFSAENGLFLMETSALNTNNVDKAFEWLAMEIFNKVYSQTTFERKGDKQPEPGHGIMLGPPITEPHPVAEKTCCKG
jgi:Ras-related protein Rab-11A